MRLYNPPGWFDVIALFSRCSCLTPKDLIYIDHWYRIESSYYNDVSCHVQLHFNSLFLQDNLKHVLVFASQWRVWSTYALRPKVATILIQVIYNFQILKIIFKTFHYFSLRYTSSPLYSGPFICTRLSWLTITEYLCHRWPGICSICRYHNDESRPRFLSFVFSQDF